LGVFPGAIACLELCVDAKRRAAANASDSTRRAAISDVSHDESLDAVSRDGSHARSKRGHPSRAPAHPPSRLVSSRSTSRGRGADLAPPVFRALANQRSTQASQRGGGGGAIRDTDDEAVADAWAMHMAAEAWSEEKEHTDGGSERKRSSGGSGNSGGSSISSVGDASRASPSGVNSFDDTASVASEARRGALLHSF